MKLANVELHYTDGTRIDERESFTFRKGAPEAKWELALRDRTKKSYEWTAKFFMQDGSKRDSQSPVPTDDEDLILEVPPEAQSGSEPCLYEAPSVLSDQRRVDHARSRRPAAVLLHAARAAFRDAAGRRRRRAAAAADQVPVGDAGWRLRRLRRASRHERRGDGRHRRRAAAARQPRRPAAPLARAGRGRQREADAVRAHHRRHGGAGRRRDSSAPSITRRSRRSTATTAPRSRWSSTIAV